MIPTGRIKSVTRPIDAIAPVRTVALAAIRNSGNLRRANCKSTKRPNGLGRGAEVKRKDRDCPGRFRVQSRGNGPARSTKLTQAKPRKQSLEIKRLAAKPRIEARLRFRALRAPAHATIALYLISSIARTRESIL